MIDFSNDSPTAEKDDWDAYQGELGRRRSVTSKGKLFPKWKQRIEELRDQIFSQLVMDWRRDHPSYQEFVLQDKLYRSQEDVAFLQEELKKKREQICDLKRMTQECDGRLASVLDKSNEQLRDGIHFDVRKTETGEQWEVVTGHCCLGGCDMGIYEFVTERDALLFAVLLDVMGFQPSHNAACATCYAEYIENCV